MSYVKDLNFLNQCLRRVRATPVIRGALVIRGAPVIPATPVVQDSICSNRVRTGGFKWRVALATSCPTERQLPAHDDVRLHQAPKATGRTEEFDCKQQRASRLGNQYSFQLSKIEMD